jgi:hypothetical protein
MKKSADKIQNKNIRNKKKTNEKECNIQLLMKTKQTCSIIYQKKGKK